MDWLRDKRFGLAALAAVIVLHGFSVFWAEVFAGKFEPAPFSVQPGTSAEAAFDQWLAQKPQGIPWLFVRNWGYHFLRYFPVPAIVFLYGIALALLVPAVHTGLVQALERAAQRVREAWSRYGWRLGLGAMAVFLLVTWLLRQKWGLLSDNAEAAATLPDSPINLQQVLTDVYYRVILALGHAVYANWNGMHALRLGNWLAGAAYLAAAVTITRLLGRNLFLKTAVLLALLTLGNIQLFFAYVGTGGLFFALLAVYLAAALAVAQQRAPFPLAAVVCVLAIAANPAGLMLLPTLLYLAWLGYPAVAKALRHPKVIVIGGIVGVAACVGVYVKLMSGNLLPWFSSSAGIYRAAFGYSHLVEMLNYNLLVAPFGLAAVVLGGLWIWRTRYPLSQDRSLMVLALMFVFLELHSVIQADGIGYADWDRLGHQGLPLALLTVYLIGLVFAEDPGGVASADAGRKASAATADAPYASLPATARWGRELCAIVLVLTGVNTLSFILVNATDLALARAKEVTLTDKAPAYSPNLNTAPIKLGIIFQKNAQFCAQADDKTRMMSEAAAQFELGMKLFPQNPAMGLNLALLRVNQGRLAEARALLVGDLQRSPFSTVKWRLLLAAVDTQLISSDPNALVQDSVAFQNLVNQSGHMLSDSEPLTLRQALGPAENASVASVLWQIALQQPPDRPENLAIRQLAIGHLLLARQLGGDQLRIDNVPIGELIQRMQASLATNAPGAPPPAAPQAAATDTNAAPSIPRSAPAQPKSQPAKAR